MEQITIYVQNQEKAKHLVEIIQSLDFVNDVQTIKFPPPQKLDADFFSLAGLWTDRDISLKNLRQKAWVHK